MFRAIAALVAVALVAASVSFPQPAEAATLEILVAQTCVNGKADADIQWRGANANATEVRVELAPTWKFNEAVESRPGPAGVANANFIWSGLEPHSFAYVRINQKVNGDWDPSNLRGVLGACGNTAAAESAKFTEVVFNQNSPPVGFGGVRTHDATQNGGTISACGSPRL